MGKWHFDNRKMILKWLRTLNKPIKSKTFIKIYDDCNCLCMNYTFYPVFVFCFVSSVVCLCLCLIYSHWKKYSYNNAIQTTCLVKIDRTLWI